MRIPQWLSNLIYGYGFSDKQWALLDLLEARREEIVGVLCNTELEAEAYTILQAELGTVEKTIETVRGVFIRQERVCIILTSRTEVVSGVFCQPFQLEIKL